MLAGGVSKVGRAGGYFYFYLEALNLQVGVVDSFGSEAPSWGQTVVCPVVMAAHHLGVKMRWYEMK